MGTETIIKGIPPYYIPVTIDGVGLGSSGTLPRHSAEQWIDREDGWIDTKT